MWITLLICPARIRAYLLMRFTAIAVTPLLLLAGCAGEMDVKPAAEAAAKVRPAPSARTVPIVDFEFRPRTITVERGTKVTWRNRDAANHTVTFKTGPGDLGNVDEGRRLSARFKKPGTYAYVCVYHPGMRGEVIVR